MICEDVTNMGWAKISRFLLVLGCDMVRFTTSQ
jgi:hypothetical protein